MEDGEEVKYTEDVGVEYLYSALGVDCWIIFGEGVEYLKKEDGVDWSRTCGDGVEYLNVGVGDLIVTGAGVMWSGVL